MKLNYKKFGSGQPLVILHGLMGMLDNWQGPAKAFGKKFETWILDLRNHGHSPHSDDFDYALMAADLNEFFSDHGLSSAHFIGHSMGGKLAMEFAQLHPEKVEKLVIVDIAPRYYPVHHDKILAALRAVPLDRITRRTEAESFMEPYVPDAGTRQFLLKSLYYREKGKFAWRFNLDSIEKNIEEVGKATDESIYEGETLFVRGSKSKYISDADWADIRVIFPMARLETIDGAGHWVHAEEPAAFVEAVMAFLLNGTTL